MKILYLSTLSSSKLVDSLYSQTGENPGFAVQKFSRLIVKGIYENSVDVETLSSPPIPKNFRYKSFIHYNYEKEDGILYRYVPFINVPILKHICVFLYTFFFIILWGIKDKKQKLIICDVLSVSLSMAALFASKLISLKNVAIVTDILDLIVGPRSFIGRIASKLNTWYITSFDKYILLTEQMNEKVNPNKKPYLVMEALCDITLNNNLLSNVIKDSPKVVLYAGGIYEKYGLKMLAEGFIKANVSNATLVYYGSGSYVESYKELCKTYSNLEYRGLAKNDQILQEEYKATLLVNPRFTTEEFTKYSFPSKNMEFMSSGTPLLTTKLPGMPEDYYPYVFMIEEETIDGYASAIKRTLALSDEELKLFGRNAKEYVLKFKNNIVQAKRILDFI